MDYNIFLLISVLTFLLCLEPMYSTSSKEGFLLYKSSSLVQNEDIFQVSFDCL